MPSLSISLLICNCQYLPANSMLHLGQILLSCDILSNLKSWLFTMLPQYRNVHYTLLPENRASRLRILGLFCKALALATFITTFVTLGFALYEPTLELPRQIVVPEILPNFRVKALVFYGRRSRVSILDCYLRVKSLADHLHHGGADTLSTAKYGWKWWAVGRSYFCCKDQRH